jgi:arginase
MLRLESGDVRGFLAKRENQIEKLKLIELNKERRRGSMITREMFQNFVTNTVSVCGVSVKEGQKLTGVEMSPGLFRQCGLLTCISELGWKVTDVGDIATEDLTDKINVCLADKKEYKWDVENSHVIGPMCEKLAEFTEQSSKRQDFTLILGGDHGLATGSIGGMLRTYPDLKVIWIDAHGDCNTPETSPSGNYHGMPVAHLLGWMKKGEVKGFDWFTPGLKAENIVYIGLRDIDPEEKKLLKDHNIKCYSPFDIEMKGGIANVMNETLKFLKAENGQKAPIHCSWDVDGCDPEFMSGTGTKSRCGLTLRESHFIMQRMFNTGNLVSMDLVEVNCLLDEKGNREMLHGDIPVLNGKETILYASELVLSGMGFSWL